MKIAVAQTKSLTGDIAGNIVRHQTLVAAAIDHGTDALFFPELSLTAYEPALAESLATTPADPRLDVFQHIADRSLIVIGVGLPTRNGRGITISLIILRPHNERLTYTKAYLHPDEEPYFTPGASFATLPINDTAVAPAICYELSVPAHAQRAAAAGAELYIASVAKSATGVTEAALRLAQIAATHSIPVLLANAVGPGDDFISAGQSAVWDRHGNQLARLDATREGLLIYDTVTQNTNEIYHETTHPAHHSI